MKNTVDRGQTIRDLEEFSHLLAGFHILGAAAERKNNLIILSWGHAAEIDQEPTFLDPSHHRGGSGPQLCVEAIERYPIEIKGHTPRSDLLCWHRTSP